MIIEAFVLSVVIGFTRKGSLRNLGRIPLRHFYLFCVPFLLFAAVSGIALSAGQKSLMPYIRIADIGQHAVLLIAIFLNLHMREMWMVAAGTFSNFAALAANGGAMPVSMDALKSAGLAGVLGTQPVRHALLTPETRLKPLTDVIPVHTFSPFLSQVVSVGDLLIAVGLFILIQHYMCPPKADEEQSTVAEALAEDSTGG